MMKCLTCNKEFVSLHIATKYCSIECRPYKQYKYDRSEAFDKQCNKCDVLLNEENSPNSYRGAICKSCSNKKAKITRRKQNKKSSDVYGQKCKHCNIILDSTNTYKSYAGAICKSCHYDRTRRWKEKTGFMYLRPKRLGGLCTTCNTVISEDNFKTYRTCKKCYGITTAQRCRIKKQTLVKTLGGKCSKCGYRGIALDFHHKDPNEKEFGIGKRSGASIAVLLKEVKKCILLCANCHREIHHNQLEE